MPGGNALAKIVVAHPLDFGKAIGSRDFCISIDIGAAAIGRIDLEKQALIGEVFGEDVRAGGDGMVFERFAVNFGSAPGDNGRSAVGQLVEELWSWAEQLDSNGVIIECGQPF